MSYKWNLSSLWFLKRMSQALNSEVPLKDQSDITTIPKATKRNRIVNRQTIGTEGKIDRFYHRMPCPSWMDLFDLLWVGWWSNQLIWYSFSSLFLPFFLILLFPSFLSLLRFSLKMKNGISKFDWWMEEKKSNEQDRKWSEKMGCFLNPRFTCGNKNEEKS